jgi:ATP-dependent Clp protease ATP-binding subunit ClpC
MNDQERFEKFSKTPTLDQMGVDLTAQARQGKLTPVNVSDRDLVRVVQVLCRHPNPRTGFRKHNIVLISEPELGRRKLAIVEGLAQLMSAPHISELTLVPEVIDPSWLSMCQEQLQGKRLVTLDVGSLIAGITSLSEATMRFETILAEIRSSQDCILFIDELHTLVGAEAAWGRLDFANLLVPALVREQLQCIGATTLDEYRRYIEKDQALQRRFQEVILHESVSSA